MWTRSRFTSLLGLDVPIVQGPFGGGNSSPALAAAVSNAGGLGSYGAVNLKPDELRALIDDIRSRTGRPFNINLWVPIPAEESANVHPLELARGRAHVAPFLAELGLSEPPQPLDGKWMPAFLEQVEALLEAKPPVFSFVMGIPDKAILAQARHRGITTMGTATTVDEAVRLDEAGVDVIIASGSDAGGHRSSFLRPAAESLVGTMSLVPQIVSAVSRPVLAAGGIADGRGIAAALALGAEGVQIGSAFLAAPEAGAPEVHKRLLGTPDARWTRLTRAFTGRFARGIENRLMSALEERPEDILPYPIQGWLTAPVRRAAGKAGRAELLALWAGQNAASARPLPAADIVAALVAETDAVLRAAHMKPRPSPQ